MKNYFKLSLLAALLLAFGCSPEPLVTDENLEAVNHKYRNGENDSNASLKVFARGAAIKGANGIDIGPDGRLYIASVNGGEIVVMNKKNGKIINRIKDKVVSPDDLIFSPDGSTLYWTDILVGEIGRMDMATGIVTKQSVAGGVNPIRFSEDGRLFTALDFLGDGLYELDPDLIEPPRLIISCPEGFGLGFFNSFDTRMEGDKLILYGPLFALNIVIAIDVDAIPDNTIFPADLSGLFSPPIRIVAGNLVDSDIINPAAAKFGPDGMLYVLDQAGKVWKVNPDGEDDKTIFTTLQPGLDNMTFDEDGSLYMTNNDEGWVAKILPNGHARILSRGGMIVPQGLAVLPGKNKQDAVFVADIFRLREFNGRSGQQVNGFKGYLIPGENTLTLPFTLSADGDNLVVSSWFGGVVQVWDPETDKAVEQFAMAVPIDAVRVNGEIAVADLGLGGVVWATDNTPILPLAVASGLATDGETLWAADWATGEIWQIDFDGNTPKPPVIVASGLSFPEGLALDEDENLLVVETGESRLSSIDLCSGEVSTIAEGLELSGPAPQDYPGAFPPTWFFDGVAVGPSGDIYVSGGGKNVIYRIAAKKGKKNHDGHGHGRDRGRRNGHGHGRGH